ncbi:MAG: helix-turn-helix transcriptional regulator [Clostridia bacterium]|nr:helix-turn-helix transcriptional regulator [Clostridia bacterium]
MLEAILEQKNISMYQLAKQSGIPYTTVSELVRGKTRIEKCSAETIYRLSRVLGVSMEDLISDSIEHRLDFEIFKSNICHMIKDNSEIDFIVSTLKNDDVRRYWNKRWYAEAFYLLAMVDYLSRINEIPLCTRYSDIRSQSLKAPLYPRDVLMALKLHPELDIREQCKREAIPEFLRFNIIESEIRNVY